MLDKSIKRLRVILKRKPGAPLPPVLLLRGYSFVTYQDGDEQAWGEIETSAGNFDEVEDAVAYFHKEFIPYLDEVKRRTIFIQKQDGEKVANFLFNQIGSQQAQRADAIEQERQALAAENARLLEKLRQPGRGSVNRPDPRSDINRILTFCRTILCYT